MIIYLLSICILISYLHCPSLPTSGRPPEILMNTFAEQSASDSFHNWSFVLRSYHNFHISNLLACFILLCKSKLQFDLRFDTVSPAGCSSILPWLEGEERLMWRAHCKHIRQDITIGELRCCCCCWRLDYFCLPWGFFSLCQKCWLEFFFFSCKGSTSTFTLKIWRVFFFVHASWCTLCCQLGNFPTPHGDFFFCQSN